MARSALGPTVGSVERVSRRGVIECGYRERFGVVAGFAPHFRELPCVGVVLFVAGMAVLTFESELLLPVASSGRIVTTATGDGEVGADQDERRVPIVALDVIRRRKPASFPMAIAAYRATWRGREDPLVVV